jgi:hypothetical protein
MSKKKKQVNQKKIIPRDLVSRIKAEQDEKPFETKMRKNYSKSKMAKWITTILSLLILSSLIYFVFLVILPHFLK